MTEHTPQDYRPLTREELDGLAGEQLPERAAMSRSAERVAQRAASRRRARKEDDRPKEDR